MKDLSNKKHFIGCDVSKDTLDFGIFLPKTDYRKFPHLKVENTPDGYREVVSWLRKQGVKPSDMVVAMEHTGIYSTTFTDWLYGKNITFTMLHPLAVRNSFSNGRNKTDKVDAQYIADYVYTQREKLSASQPESKEIKELRELMSERNISVKSRTMYKNILKTQKNRNVRRRTENAIKSLDLHIKQTEEGMLECISQNPEIKKNYDLLDSIMGIGLINAVATIVSTGNFTRFQTARQYAKFCKVSPLEYQSGTSVRGGTHVPTMGHGELKALLTNAAKSATRNDPQLRAYYERKVAEGKSYGCVMNAIKFKLIERMFCVIKRGTPYVLTENFRSR